MPAARAKATPARPHSGTRTSNPSIVGFWRRVRMSSATPATAAATDTVSRWAPPTSTARSAGFSSHNTATRPLTRWFSPASRYNSAPVTRNAAPTTSCSSHTVSRRSPAPTIAATSNSAVATGPYTLVVPSHGASTAPITASAVGQVFGATTYGSAPSALIRP
ncbi:hypothetical protein Kisp01_34210 [Kineosporia sp. NBRC 101677]|nr:hypothetical protein Kisp01_34210 [Kineosporia sp. NBRC 101677]